MRLSSENCEPRDSCSAKSWMMSLCRTNAHQNNYVLCTRIFHDLLRNKVNCSINGSMQGKCYQLFLHCALMLFFVNLTCY